MRTSEARGLSTEELEREYRNRLVEIFNLRFRLETEQFSKTSAIRNARRDIARIKTILHERRGEKAAK